MLVCQWFCFVSVSCVWVYVEDIHVIGVEAHPFDINAAFKILEIQFKIPIKIIYAELNHQHSLGQIKYQEHMH